MAKKRSSGPVFQFRPHPWHGLEVGPDPPGHVNAFIEITPFDLMKYEVDKVSGYLHVDRPQRFSAQHPALYGFIPRTYCAERVRKLAPGSKRGDGDPLDICVLSERVIARNEIIVRCSVIGGLQMIDRGEADDKLIAVLENDNMWGTARTARADRTPAALLSDLQTGSRPAGDRPHPQGVWARSRVERGAGVDRRLRCGVPRRDAKRVELQGRRRHRKLRRQAN